MLRSSHLIVGINGQDGQLMKDLLNSRGEEWIGVTRNGFFSNGNCILRIENYSTIAIAKILSDYRIGYIYFFAAVSNSSELRATMFRNGIEQTKNDDVFNLLMLIKEASIIQRYEIKLFFASSSLIFAGSKLSVQNELTEYQPLEDYAVKKINAMKFLDDNIGSSTNLQIYIGILYNHESIYRPKTFLTAKVISFVINASGLDSNALSKNNLKLEISNSSRIIDFSLASDFVIDIYNLLQFGRAGKYIFSSGLGITVIDFCKEVFQYFGLNYSEYVIVKNMYSKELSQNQSILIGDNSKLFAEIGYKKLTDSRKFSHKLIEQWVVSLEKRK